MSTWNFALVGCGKIAQKHAFAVGTYLPNARVVAVCDIDAGKARALADSTGAEAYSSITEMMDARADDIDIVSVLTPSGHHAENATELVPYEKPLVVEKPLALRLDEADHMLRLCDSHGVKLFVVHQNRYNAPIMKARESLETGRLGRPVLGTVRVRWKRDQSYYDSASWRGTWAYDGGVFANQASHHIDMLSWFMGQPISVKAVASTSLVNIECEDTGAALVRYDEGGIGIIEATTAARPKDLEGSISILGEHGSVVVGGFFMEKLLTWEFQTPLPEDETVFEQFGQNPDGWGYNLGEYLKGAITALETNRSGLVDGLEGRKSLELISAIYESIETGEEVNIRFSPRRCRLGLR